MAITPFPERPPVTTVSPRGNERLASVSDLHPPLQEGVFIPDLPVYETEVDTSYRKTIDTIRHEGLGTTWIEEWHMSDGTRNEIAISEPRRGGISNLVLKDTALGTQARGGLNIDVARRFLQLDLPSAIKGPDIDASIPLSHSAHNTVKIFQVLAKLGYYDPAAISIEGFSRGSMIGFGTAAYAGQAGIRTLYANLTDPCIAFSPAETIAAIAAELRESPEQVLERLKNAGQEVVTTAYQVGKLLLRPAKAWHYRKTSDFSPRGVKQLIDSAGPVFSGEARLLAQNFPKDMQATVAFCINSFANDEAEFSDILSDAPGVEIRRFGRGHASGIDEQILGNISLRFGGLAEQLRAGVEPEDLDYSLIHKRTEPQALAATS